MVMRHALIDNEDQNNIFFKETIFFTLIKFAIKLKFRKSDAQKFINYSILPRYICMCMYYYTTYKMINES